MLTNYAQPRKCGISLPIAAAGKSNPSLGVMPMHSTFYGGALTPVPGVRHFWNIWCVATLIFSIKAITYLPCGNRKDLTLWAKNINNLSHFYWITGTYAFK
jgi:hypothetical protein